MSNTQTTMFQISLPWPWYILAFIAYVASGIILSSLAPQSQIVPIWLPAGIALVACYIWWWRFFPAVFIASFLFNFSTHRIEYLSEISPALLYEGLLISSGATLQAMVGSALLKYWLGNPLTLNSEKRIIGFIFIVGVLVNLIAANIGVFALSHFSETYSADNFLNNMFMWWMGDSLGVLVGAPFILSFIRLNNIDLHSRKSRILILSISSALLITVYFTTLMFSKYSYKNALKLANREVQVIENGINGEINKNQSQLQLLARFLHTNPSVSRQEFDDFSQNIISRQSAIKALSWNPVIEQSEAQQFAKQLYEIYQRPISLVGSPLNEQDPLVVVKYISPEQGNQTAIGFNVNSDQARKTALLNSDEPYSLRATPIIRLIQSSQSEPAYLLFSAVLSQRRTESAIDEAKHIIGYATGVFLIEQMLQHALRTADTDIFLYELFDKNASEVFAENTQKANISLANETNLITLSFNMSGQTWQMNLVPKRNYLLHHQSDLSALLYIFQIVIVAFSMTLVLLMNSRQLVLNHLVEERTNELLNAKQEADLANKAKGQFLANMSHELRTPLNAVIGFSQLAKQTNNNDILRSYINKIATASGTLLALINDILDFSKIESNKLTLEMTPFNMQELLGRVDSMFESSAASKKIQWRVFNQLPENLWVTGDSLRLEQIIINLCSNAIKFTQQGKVELAVCLKNNAQTLNPKEQVSIKFSVKDTGMGMTEKQQQSLFSAFTQADSSTTRKFGGTGLGLAISHKLCEMMGGKIEVESKPNTGSEFFFDVRLDVCSPAESDEEMQPHDTAIFLNKKILVAEDNEINQIVISEMLRNLGVKFIVVTNGAMAVEAITESSFDLILMDCQMPIMDGYEATSQIRQQVNLQQLPIVALTADVTQESRERASQAGFTAHLSKPISMEKLTTCLLKYLSSTRQLNLNSE